MLQKNSSALFTHLKHREQRKTMFLTINLSFKTEGNFHWSSKTQQQKRVRGSWGETLSAMMKPRISTSESAAKRLEASRISCQQTSVTRRKSLPWPRPKQNEGQRYANKQKDFLRTENLAGQLRLVAATISSGNYADLSSWQCYLANSTVPRTSTWLP